MHQQRHGTRVFRPAVGENDHPNVFCVPAQLQRCVPNCSHDRVIDQISTRVAQEPEIGTVYTLLHKTVLQNVLSWLIVNEMHSQNRVRYSTHIRSQLCYCICTADAVQKLPIYDA